MSLRSPAGLCPTRTVDPSLPASHPSGTSAQCCSSPSAFCNRSRNATAPRGFWPRCSRLPPSVCVGVGKRGHPHRSQQCISYPKNGRFQVGAHLAAILCLAPPESMTLDTLVFVFPQNMTRDVTVSQITSDQGGSLVRLELQPCFFVWRAAWAPNRSG